MPTVLNYCINQLCYAILSVMLCCVHLCHNKTEHEKRIRELEVYLTLFFTYCIIILNQEIQDVGFVVIQFVVT